MRPTLRRYFLASALALAAALGIQASMVEPQISDAQGDANGINGQGLANVPGLSLDFEPTSFDITEVAFATDNTGQAATTLTVKMSLFGPVCTSDPLSCGPGAAYSVSADAGGCKFELRFPVGAAGDGATASVCASGSTTPVSRVVQAEATDNSVSWTLPLATFAGTVLAPGIELKALYANSTINLATANLLIVDEARGAKNYTVGQVNPPRAQREVPADSPTDARWTLRHDREVSRYLLTGPGHCPAGDFNDNCFQTDAEAEPSIAANPENPLNAVAVFQSGRRGSGAAAINGYAVTFDGGATWERGLLPGLSTATGGAAPRVSDPVVAFGPGNRVYVNTLVVGDAAAGDLAVNASADGGRTWANPSYLVDPRVTGTDKNWMVVDTGTAAGHHPGRIYVIWSAGVFFYAYSDDGGSTWLPSSSGSVLSPSNGVGAIPLVLPNGDLAVVWTTAAGAPYPRLPLDTTLTKVVITVAKGAGSVPTGAPLTFTPPTTISSYEGHDVFAHRGGESLVAAAVDPKSGAIYVAWNDARYRSDLANDIVLATSTDGGLNWNEPVLVNGGGASDERDRFLPGAGIGPSGEVLVSYREVDSRRGAGVTRSRGVATVMHVSTDGGRKFARGLRVDQAGGDLAFAVRSGEDSFLGDYHQIATSGALAYVVHTEPVRANSAEAAEVPSKFQHQRTWVAVVERIAAAPTSVPTPTPTPVATPTPAPTPVPDAQPQPAQTPPQPTPETTPLELAPASAVPTPEPTAPSAVSSSRGGAMRMMDALFLMLGGLFWRALLAPSPRPSPGGRGGNFSFSLREKVARSAG